MIELFLKVQFEMDKRVAKAKSMKNLVDFKGHICIFGMGSVGRAVLPLLFQLIKFDHSKLTIIDMENVKSHIQYYIDRGAKFKQMKITEKNYKKILEEYNKGDFLIDCAWNIDTLDLLRVCAQRGIMYINSSVEEWDPYDNNSHLRPQDYTLYGRQLEIRDFINKELGGGKGYPTMVLDHGANPGMVSHLVKCGMISISKYILKDPKVSKTQKNKIREYVKLGAFNLLAQTLGIKVIHISERDTQITNKPKEVDEFVNTWSPEGFREEGAFSPSELGYGTHEKYNPTDAIFHKIGDRNQICLKSRGMHTKMHSYIKSGHIIGMLIRHGEAYSISDRLSVFPADIKTPKNYLIAQKNKDHTEKVVYRPTVYYVYTPCDSAIASMHELVLNDYKKQLKDRLMYDDIVSGRDELGVLDSWRFRRI